MERVAKVSRIYIFGSADHDRQLRLEATRKLRAIVGAPVPTTGTALARMQLSAGILDAKYK